MMMIMKLSQPALMPVHMCVWYLRHATCVCGIYGMPCIRYHTHHTYVCELTHHTHVCGITHMFVGGIYGMRTCVCAIYAMPCSAAVPLSSFDIIRLCLHVCVYGICMYTHCDGSAHVIWYMYVYTRMHTQPHTRQEGPEGDDGRGDLLQQVVDATCCGV